MSDYVLIPALERASISDYVSLFDKSFLGDEKLNAAYLRWQYEFNPHGRVIGMDAFLDNALVAHYGIIPMRYRLGNQYFDAALSVNTATHPQHQGKGLFTKLAAATYDLASQQGVQFIIGAANSNSVSGFTRKLGFLNLGQVRLYMSYCGPRFNESTLDLDASAQWISWRLANPSRKYQILHHNDGTSTISTRVKSIGFNIARLNLSDVDLSMTHSNIKMSSSLIPRLTPFFGPKPPSVFLLPLIMQPSPWHMIWKSLDVTTSDSSLVSRIQLSGFGMDTF